jgi:hypothetical protein
LITFVLTIFHYSINREDMFFISVFYFSIRETILNVIYAHKPYWKCYQYQDTYSINSVIHSKEEIANRHIIMVTYK